MKIEITATNSKERFALAMELKSLGVEYKHPDYDRDVFIVDGSEYIVEGLASYCDEQNILYVSEQHNKILEEIDFVLEKLKNQSTSAETVAKLAEANTEVQKNLN